MTTQIPIVTRLGKGSPLEFEEMDKNLLSLKQGIEDTINNQTQGLSLSLQQVTNRVSTAEFDIAALKTADQSIAQSITTLQHATEVNLTGAVGVLVTSINGVSTRVDTLETTVSGHGKSLTSLSDAMNLLSSVKADRTYVDSRDAAKADAKHIHSMADISDYVPPVGDVTKAYVDAGLAKKADITSVVASLNNKADKTYVDNLAIGQTGAISAIELLQTDVRNLRDDVNFLRTDKASKSSVDALITTVSSKADASTVNLELAKKESKNFLAGKSVDFSSRTNNSIPVYDQTTDTYIHKEIKSVQGDLANEIDALTLNKADKTYVDTELAKKALVAHSHTAGDISGLPAAPDVNKAYVDTELAKKANTAYVSGEVTALVSLLGEKPDKTYVDAELAKKSALAHTHSASDITGLTMTTPNRFVYSSGNISVLAGNSRDLEATIPSIRLYGVTVKVEGIPAGQKCLLELYGDSGGTIKQYSAEFSDILSVDSSQAWMYRNFDGAHLMYLRLNNATLTNFTNIVVTIVAEPF